MPAPTPHSTAFTAIYFTRDRLIWCDTKSNSALAFAYPPEAVKDLDITNGEVLSAQLRLFLNQHQITPLNLVFLLSSDICFEHNLTHLSEDQRQAETQKFLDTIPFDRVSSKAFHFGNEFKLVAISTDFYESFRAIFVQLGFTVSAVAPLAIFGNLGVKNEFTPDSCRLISKRIDFIVENSFVSPNPDTQTRTEKRRLFLGRHNLIFALLSLAAVAIAGITAFVTLRRPPSASQPPILVVSAPAVTLAPAPTVSPAELTVLLSVPSGRTSTSRVVDTLRLLGLTRISSATASALSAGNQISYSPRVPVEFRRQIETGLSKIVATPSAVEAADTQFDINIRLPLDNAF